MRSSERDLTEFPRILNARGASAEGRTPSAQRTGMRPVIIAEQLLRNMGGKARKGSGRAAVHRGQTSYCEITARPIGHRQ